MTKLTKAYHALFEQGISPAEYERRYQAYTALYFRQRERMERSPFGRMTINQRKAIFPVLYFANKVKNWLFGLRRTILADRRTPSDRPVIYAVTHVGKFDIEVVLDVLFQHVQLLTSDFQHIHGSLNEIFLYAIGPVFFNHMVKEDRRAAVEKMIALLRDGRSLLYFPEGTWNLSPNLPLLPCFWGIVDVAQQGNAVIVPVAMQQYGRRFEVIIGENLDVQPYPHTPEGKTQALTALRDAMATLKWEIWERHPAKRTDIAEHEWEDYVATRYAEWNYPTTDYCDRMCYKPKGVTKPEEAFAHLRRLVPRRENAFLFDKYAKG